jgi:hypothetical protein
MMFQRWLVADSGVMAGGDSGAGPEAGLGRRWDVALSFAGAQREYVERVAAALKARRVRCFYDADEQVELWGRHLAEELPAVYAGQAGLTVVFISAEYAAGDWTRLERRAALGRAVRERREYVLPARFDDTALPGLLDDVVAVDLRRHAPKRFADLVAAKLASLAASPGGPVLPLRVSRERRRHRAHIRPLTSRPSVSHRGVYRPTSEPGWAVTRQRTAR